MSINRGYDGVSPLVSITAGLDYRDLVIKKTPGIITGNPAEANRTATPYQEALDQAFVHTKETGRFTNGSKLALRSFQLLTDGLLEITTTRTDFFTLWGLPSVARELQQQAVNDLVTKKSTGIPVGISTHNVLLLSGNLAPLSINNASHGFAPGRMSLAIEGQTDPDKDLIPHNTVYREVIEELGEGVSLDPLQIKLLGIGAETGSSYASFCYVVSIGNSVDELVKSWSNTKNREASALLVAPIADLGHVLLPENQGGALQKYIVGGQIDSQKVIKLHPTVLWRYDLLNAHLTAIQAR